MSISSTQSDNRDVTKARNALERMLRASDIDFIREQTGLMPIKPPRPLISEYAAEKRILPSNTPFPGYWDNQKTPYCMELMDNMSPHSPVTEQAAVKGAQLGFTSASENVIAYYMDECPTEILYVSATERLLTDWIETRMDPLISSCGFRHKITAQVDSSKSRRSGDKTFSKSYPGGRLDLASAQSASSLRSKSKRILILDEIDAAPKMLKTGEGHWLKVAKARTNAWGPRKKIMSFSTPTTIDKSEIWKKFLSGDQRKYLVPCPRCGKRQELIFSMDQGEHGLKADKKAGELLQAYYLCEFCHDPIFNHHKTAMLSGGVWVPTISQRAGLIPTYQISTLYSPVGMFSWSELWQEYEDSQEDPDGMRSFVTLYLAQPFKETGSRPKLENVIELRGGYREKEVPDGVLYLIGGIDVQTGSKNDPDNPERLELEIAGIGAGYRSWSIAYLVFEGPVGDPFSGAWEDLNEFAMNGGLAFKRKRDGRVFGPSLILADSGDGNMTDIVYRFTSRWPNTYPSKGFSALKRHKGEKGDEAGPYNFRRYRQEKITADTFLTSISTNYYKTQIYNNLKIVRKPLDPQGAGFCDFPVDRGEKYFKMLTAEEKRTDGSFHCPSGRRNEALDCRVMCLCAADIWLDKRMQELMAGAKADGATPAQISQINHRLVIDMLVKKMAGPGPKSAAKTAKK